MKSQTDALRALGKRLASRLVSFLSGLLGSWRQRPSEEAAGLWNGLIDEILTRYHFTEQATAWLRRGITVEVQNLATTTGGGYWIPQERRVLLFTAQHEAAVHELAHAWWHFRRVGQERQLIEAVVRAASETDPRYHRVQHLAHGYVYGTPHDGWPGLLVDNNDWEMFAGLASGTMGDMRLMPPYLRVFYQGLFQMPPE